MPARPRRFRRAIKWCAVAGCLLLAATWIMSRWFGGDLWIVQGTGGALFRLQGGAIDIWRIGGTPGARLHVQFVLVPFDQVNEWEWLPYWNRGANFGLPNTSVYASLPLWFPLILLLAPTTYLFLRDRLALPNSCPHCSYPLSGLPPNSPCPECGRLPS